jgi:hypothetical protein
MGFVRNAQPTPVALPGLKVDTYGTATAIPIGLSNDRRTVYGTALGMATQLQQSTTDGTSWTNVFNFTGITGITALVETDDGEALAIGYTSGSTALGNIYKSTGWSTSHTTATWTQVLATTGGYIRAQWAAAMGDDNVRANTSRVVLVGEYGGVTTASGDQTLKATRLWISTDYGATWTLILNLATRYPGVANLHMHGYAYDPWWDRIWALYGDSLGDGDTSKLKLLYSDDRGTTWTAFPVGVGYSGNGGAQSTTIAALESGLVIGSDNIPGFFRIGRKGYRKAGSLQLAYAMVGGGGSMFIASKTHINRKQPGAVLLAGWQSQSAECRSGILISRDGGATLTTLWDDPAMAGGSKGVLNVFGPTWSGKILAHVSPNGTDAGGGTQWLLRGDLIVPDEGLVDGRATVTGDAATTVFNLPHGLAAAPSRYVVWEEQPATAYTVSVTSTNIVLTFATAPANAKVIQFQWRAAV